ncbi:Hsp20 family protein [Ectobacillus funiculus]|uniref:Hsp20/alpha crystallin family protein n=1 Tax=Ectobacillus funiculus TaxID=137993 RepID=UPI0039785569
MCAKKKKDCFFQVEGFEQWMDQFFADPYASFYYPEGLRIDLFETEREYILEADVPPNACQSDIMIEKTENGLRILIQTKTGPALMRDIQLPVNIMYKRMNASFENGLLEIHISKNEMVSAKEHTIHFPDEGCK